MTHWGYPEMFSSKDVKGACAFPQVLSYLGKAPTTPPSTGRVAPVVGV